MSDVLMLGLMVTVFNLFPSNPLEQDSEADTERATTPEEGMFGSAAGKY